MRIGIGQILFRHPTLREITLHVKKITDLELISKETP